jgi:hypothetical protein
MATEVVLSAVLSEWAKSASDTPFRLQHHISSCYAGTIKHDGLWINYA